MFITDKIGNIYMPFKDVVDPTAKTAFLLTNEAIARAALEADVKVTAFYPGSPTSEILDTIYLLSQRYDDLKMEVSINEKVALEIVAGASMGGARSFTSMKSVGLNVASDTFYSLGYTGINAGCVLVVADDPHAHSSQSEQDGRYYAPTGHIPMLEPSTPQEAYEMTKYAFELSEQYKVLMLIRTTTRVNHQSAPVKISDVKRSPFQKKRWKDIEAKYYTLSETARRLKHEAINKLNQIQEAFETSPFNTIHKGKGPIGIITNGVSYLHTLEAMKTLNVKLPLLKLGTLYPLPKKLIAQFLEQIDTCIIIEELMPYLEDAIMLIAKDVKPNLKLIGKNTDTFSKVGEYNSTIIMDTLAKILNRKPPTNYEALLTRADELKSILPQRFPTFCPGCPHRGTIWSVLQALKGVDYVLNNDIGCYSMLLLEPYGITDSLLDMGASQGLSSGMQYALEDKIVSFLGDSTFFHAAIPGIINAIHNRHDYTVVILDNSVTAMTGQQPNPGSDFGAASVDEIDIPSVLRGIGVQNITILDAFSPKENVKQIKDAMKQPGVKAIVSIGPCALYSDRLKRRKQIPIIPNQISEEECKTIYTCIRDFYCPAIQLNTATRQTNIQLELCNGCGNCAQLCPRSAIHTTGGE
jgi:indolepyruvate ferredoxin oxidoreductase alpha subunit